MNNEFLLNEIRINHVGFTPHSLKTFVIGNPPEKEFGVFKLQDTLFTCVYKGVLEQKGTELEAGWVGNFTGFKDEGIYRIHCGELNSRCFIIYKDLYRNPARLLHNYFLWQRCGESGTGWDSPCHLDDSITLPSGELKDLSGGYHQSCDLRKWTWGLSLGLVGLVQYALVANAKWDNGQLEEEIKRGSEYLQKMTRDDGGIMDSCFLPEGWEARKEGENKGHNDYSALWGKREFYIQDSPDPSQWNSIRFQALAAKYFEKKDEEYSKKCLDYGLKNWSYMASKKENTKYKPFKIPAIGHDNFFDNVFGGFYEGSALEYSHRLCAAISLYKATGDNIYLDDASKCATQLSNLQFEGDNITENPASACFKEHAESEAVANSYIYFWNTSAPIGLCDILELAPNHPDAAKWNICVRKIAEQCNVISKRNTWSRLPVTWKLDSPKGPVCFSFSTTSEGKDDDMNFGGNVVFKKGTQEDTPCFYRYYDFCYNLDIIAQAIFLKKASIILNNKDYAGLAHRQLDWILGSNPFDSSSVEGLGYNQPHRGIFGEFFPPVPQIPGAVFTGITKHSFDPKGYGLDNEYDMPMVGWLLWLMGNS